MKSRRGVMVGALGLALTALLAACGPASAVLPHVHVKPPLVPVNDHPVPVLTDHPTLVTRRESLSVTPAALTRGSLDVWLKRPGHSRHLLVSIGGLDYKWLRRWQVAGSLVLLEVGTPPSAHPKSNEYLHVALVLDTRTNKVLYQGVVAITTIAFLDPPWLVKAGPASLLGRERAEWLINVHTGLETRVLFPRDTVGVGEVANGRVHYITMVGGTRVDHSLPIPRTGWKRVKSIAVLKVSGKKSGQPSAAGAVLTQS